MYVTYDANHYPYPSKRQVIYGHKGMVCTSQPLAAQAGLEILKKGGNAIDAAVATAACMPVVEPTSNGIGSDTFALIWTGGKLYGLNGSGPAPMLAEAAKIRAMGYETMPERGWIPVNVPGTPSAWATLSGRFGRLPFEDVLAPAIDLAENGYPVSPTCAHYWNLTYKKYAETRTGEEYKAWFDTFARNGRAPQPGEMWNSPDHARTLKRIAETKGEAFYRGELADIIDRTSRAQGGLLRREDLAAYHAEWVEPISTKYRGYDVWEIPPNGHGIVALMTLNILSQFESVSHDDEPTIHRQLEAMKLAYADGAKYVTDPKCMTQRVQDMLSMDYAKARAAEISDTALTPFAGDPSCGGTIYLCTADGEGNMVSLIQSNYTGFGSGIVIPGTGISLNDRGANFSLDDAHDNVIAPGKKSYHTIIPGFLTRDGEAVGPFGVMGGFMQPQGHVQVVMNTIDFHMNPQQALDAPRWQWVGDKKIQVERGFSDETVRSLIARGHEVEVTADEGAFGRGQIIWRDEHGVLAGATEPRTDGTVAVW